MTLSGGVERSSMAMLSTDGVAVDAYASSSSSGMVLKLLGMKQTVRADDDDDDDSLSLCFSSGMLSSSSLNSDSF